MGLPNIPLRSGGLPISYTVYRDGAYIVVKDGRKGEVVYKNTDAATAIQWAIDNCFEGGTVYISNGIYDITKTIDIKVKMMMKMKTALFDLFV